MSKPVFGQREAQAIACEHTRVLKDHAEYRKDGARVRRARQRHAGRMLGWITFCSAGFAATLVFASDRVATVVQGVSRALPL